MNIKSYVILQDEDPVKLEEKVNEIIDKGYVPLGGISIIFRNQYATVFAQSVYFPDSTHHKCKAETLSDYINIKNESEKSQSKTAE